jgi:Protein of unknown function (DUF3616)
MEGVSHPPRNAPARAVAVAAIVLLAASALAADLGPIHTIAGGPFEASGVVVLPDGKGLLFVDDARPDAVLWMELAADGSPKAAPVRIPLGVSVVDPEGLTTDGRHVYIVGSQSRGRASAGAGLVRFRFDAARGAVQGAETVNGLSEILAAAIPEVRTTGGKKKAPLNIEGIAWDAKGGRLLLGLRAPLDGRQAILIPVRLRDASGPFAAANLAVEQPIRLDLGGEGIRGIEADAEGGFWIIAGGSTGNPGPSRIVRWDGTGSAVRVTATLPGHLKAEGIARMVVGGKPVTVVLCDTSQYLLLP